MAGNRPSWRASYVALARSGELEERARSLDAMLADCAVCPRACRVDRHHELGTCATGADPVIASWSPHFGEEPVISGRRGSGTVFLANCNLACVFCQNHDISQRPRAYLDKQVPDEVVATMFLELQDVGCHNINWVSPSHQVPQLVRALAIAAGRGLTIPIVYNTNAYDSVETVRLLDGVVDIYMPDLKYAHASAGETLSGVPDYPERARAALQEMYGQIGDCWQLGHDGSLQRGILVRILVLPGELAGVEQSLSWISSEMSPKIAISLLAQYHPAHHAACPGRFPALERPISGAEWRDAVLAVTRHMEGDRHHVQGTMRLKL